MTSDVEQDRTGGPLAAARAAGAETWQSLTAVFRNPNLRRIQLALAGSLIGDWAYGTAVAVWAYGVGGAKAVGIWAAIRLALLAVISPVGAAIADRYPRKPVMVAADGTRFVLVVVAAFCLVSDLPAGFVFVLATLAAVAGTPFRPAQRALMPTLANNPAELTASNGTSSTMESLAFFAGPAIGALLITLTDVPTVFFLNAATFVLSMLLVLAIRPEAAATAPTTDPDPEGASDGDEASPGFLAEVTAGFRLIVQDKNLFLVIAECAAQTVVAGAASVYLVLIAVDILGTGPKGIGYLDSVFGVGAVVGGFYAISRATRHRLARDMTAGVLLWSLPLLLVAVWPTPVGAFAAVLLLGFGNPMVDVNLDTIVQRITPDAVLGRVFGALEAVAIAAMAVGAAVMPFLADWLGLRGGLAVLALAVAALAVLGAPRMLRLDRDLQPPVHLPLLEALPMFAPLEPAVLEQLARRLVPRQVAAGEVVVREGEESDRFYVIGSGRVEVTQAGSVLRHEGLGEFFGEIGLLRDVPRTATVTAEVDTEVLALSREDFLGAVTGQTEARTAAEDVVRTRLTT